MMDLFAREEQVLEKAIAYVTENCEQNTCSIEQYQNLIKEYAKVLKQLRRVTKVSDKTAVELNQDKINLLTKVHIDELTKLYNRRFFDTELEASYEYCKENQTSLSVLMLDVDFFKQYNDTYGHSAGDECLKMIAKTIQNEVEEVDGFAARYGGEEFVVVIRNFQSYKLKLVAEAILEAIRQLNIPHEKNGDKKEVTISIGGFCEEVSGELEVGEYVRRADVALYKSKQTGRDKYTYYTKED